MLYIIQILLIFCLEHVSSFSQIKVCQSKDCMKQFSSTNYDGNLIQMLTDLLPPGESASSNSSKIKIESCGCLSNCGRGPNVLIRHDNNERVFNGVQDIQTVAAILDVGVGIDCPIEIMVAIDMITKVNKSKICSIFTTLY